MKNSIDLVSGVEYSFIDIDFQPLEDAWLVLNPGVTYNKTGKINFRFGLNYNRKLSNRFYLKSGIRLMNLAHEAVFTAVDTISGKRPFFSDLYKEQWIFEIPLICRYEYSIQKISPFMEMGISSNLNFSKNEESRSRLEYNIVNNSKKLNLSANVSIGAHYHLHEKYALFLQAVVRYHFTKMADVVLRDYLYRFVPGQGIVVDTMLATSRSDLYSLGLEFGIRTRF